MRAAPLAVDVDAEAAVGLLAGEERAHHGPSSTCAASGGSVLAEQVALRLEDDAGLVRLEQPVDRAHGDAELSREQVEQEAVAPDAVRIEPVLAHDPDPA